jgi:leader peptidase (prepilin peptidase) / N-methyltransferase
VTAHGLVLIFFAAVLVVLSVIDLRSRRLPNRIVLPAAAIVLAAQIAISPARAPEWIVAAAGASGFLLAASLLNPAGLGMGDVKLALLLGAALGWAVLGALLIGFAAAGAAGLVLIARNGWAARGTAIPLAPFLAAGALAALVSY